MPITGCNSLCCWCCCCCCWWCCGSCSCFGGRERWHARRGVVVQSRSILCSSFVSIFCYSIRCQFHQHLCAAFTLVGPKSAKRHCQLDCLFFGHSGSMCVKAEHRALMKLSPALSLLNHTHTHSLTNRLPHAHLLFSWLFFSLSFSTSLWCPLLFWIYPD